MGKQIVSSFIYSNLHPNSTSVMHLQFTKLVGAEGSGYT